MYGKQTECAIAAISRLAEVYDAGDTILSAAEIAESRGLQPPFVAKTLSTLSQAGLVIGSRGPGGGFTLAHEPKDIRLYDVFCLFERESATVRCPFGGGICGDGNNCPLHDKLTGVQDAVNDVLHNTTFEVFQVAAAKKGASSKPSKNSRSRK